ncbi:hypothetical protein [Armatimonas rosea]|uniref:Uncharacterized protein n=1 Tax=Armatimonas rosea TaxID=685828 RepID=A0A7W9SUA6_ARMRO|nr:hypothetical protein [Armatimonas rosea]MBB6052109.1 hypothetical protein [Armatimonas rosea]
MQSIVLVLHSKKNDFKGQDGNQVKSLKLSYIPCDPPENSEGECGIAVIEGESLPFDQAVQIKEIPGFYDLEYAPTPKKNKYGRTEQVLMPRRLSFRAGAAQKVAELIASGNLPVGVGKP